MSCIALAAEAQSTSAYSTPGPAPGPNNLSLSRALQMVWSQNPLVREAESAIEAAGYGVSGSYGGFLPSITVINGNGRNALSSIQGSLPLWRGGLTFAQIEGSEAREAAARAGLVKARLTLGNETLIAFYNFAQAQEQLRQWKKYLAALAQLQTTITNRAEEGVAPQADVQTVVSRMLQAEVGQEAANLLLGTSRNELARLLQFTPVSVAPEPELSPAVVTLAAAPAAELVDTHPDVLIAAAQVDEQIAVVKQVRSQLSPELALQYRHYYEGTPFDPTADEPQLVLQYQVGNGYAAYQRYNAERAKQDAARAHLEVVRREVEATIRLTREQLSSSGLQFQLQEQAVASSQALIEGFLRQYQAGRRSWVEVLNAQREAHDNELGYIASRKAYLLSGQQMALQSLAWGLLVGPAPP